MHFMIFMIHLQSHIPCRYSVQISVLLLFTKSSIVAAKRLFGTITSTLVDILISTMVQRYRQLPSSRRIFAIWSHSVQATVMVTDAITIYWHLSTITTINATPIAILSRIRTVIDIDSPSLLCSHGTMAIHA